MVAFVSQLLSKDYFDKTSKKKQSESGVSTPTLSSTFRQTNFDEGKEKFPNYLTGVKFKLDGEDSK